ncbi:uncharacterized protein LOC131245204 [Magnolia sinica]|uniref:uncharacterized protein LOC131245204 n=1 Tax=Magnolia sinica TaxID=86752 RepID=UPI00265A89E5|nr:uncharacterized protein LOC131245204 [Magnolia sinica]
MGCTSSKRIDSSIAADVYRPAPTSFALFDINAIEEPWLIATAQQQQHHHEKSSHVPAPILEKLDTFELASDAPHSWSEVSKALEDLKPTLNQKPPPASEADPPGTKPYPPAQDSPTLQKPIMKKTQSFHTLEELDAKVSTQKTETRLPKLPPPEHDGSKIDSEGFKPVRENSFIIRDRLERQGKVDRESEPRRLGGRTRRDPLAAYPEKCPPGGSDAVVLYTTSLRGVRRTFEDCQRLRALLEGQRVAVDERDVSLHGGFLSELKEMVGEGAGVPRLFLKGRYLGGVEEVVDLNESGRLGELLDWVGVGRALGRRACEGCGGARFVPCLECNGSCKVLGGDGKQTVRCAVCNENGLVLCPLCHY